MRAVRALSQSGLEPANCRLLDPGEAASSAGGSGVEALLVLGFESADHDLEPWMRARRRALPRPRRRAAGRRDPHAHRRGRDPRGRRRRLAQLVHQRALPARRAGLDRHPRRDVRDRDHLGPLRAPARARDEGSAGCAGADLRRGLAHLPLHPRLSRRPGAVLLAARAHPARRRARAVGRSEADRERHPRPQKAPRSPTTTRSAATTAPGTTANDPTASPARCARPSPSSTRAGS